MCPQNPFFGFKSNGMGFFLEKTQKLYLVPHFPKKVYIHFCCPTPVPLKMIMHPKNNFSLLFWKILSFSKKLLDEKYSKHRCLQKRLYCFLLSDVPISSERSCPPTNGFSQFSPKILLLSKNLFYNKTFEYKYIWRGRNVSSVAGMIEHTARIISVI